MVAVFMRRRPDQCRTDRPRIVTKRAWLAVGLTALATASPAADWPGFLPPPDAYAPAEVFAIRRAWTDPTLHRAVEGPPAPMPLGSYLVLVDAPELTAAAARHLGIARYEVREVAADWYEADDHDGSHGVYHVLVREGGRRVTLSWGSRRSALLGTIRGSALTAVEFVADGERTRQRLDTYVVIDNIVAAGLARALVVIFGRVADRKLAHGFQVTAKVAAWATEHPDEFCAWAAAQPADHARGRPVSATLPPCADGGQPPASVAR